MSGLRRIRRAMDFIVDGVGVLPLGAYRLIGATLGGAGRHVRLHEANHCYSFEACSTFPVATSVPLAASGDGGIPCGIAG